MGSLTETKTYNIAEFIRWHTSDELNLSPKFQRNSVWNLQAKSYLIDTILRGLPIPTIFIRQTVDVKVSKVFKEIIDGQQRLRTILDFYGNQFSVNGPYAQKDTNKKKFSELSDDLKEAFLSYDVAVQIVKTKEDWLVYDMFARLNTNNMVLNRQELRNSQYWGLFKGLVYEIGRETKERFMDWRLYQDKEFIRMKDYELINSLVIYLLEGIRSETPAIVDGFYKKYDESFEQAEHVISEFFSLISVLDRIYDTGYRLSAFNTPRYFYSLFAAIGEQRKKTKEVDINSLVERLSRLESHLESDDRGEFEAKILKIKNLHQTRTTSAKERVERVELISEFLFP